MTVSLKVIPEGTIRGIDLGQRPSGIRVVGITDGKPDNVRIQIILPTFMKYAPSVYLWALDNSRRIFAAGDGCVVIVPGYDEVGLLSQLEALVAAGDRGGIAAGKYGDFTVTSSETAWRYEVEGPASARASLKRIGGEWIAGSPNRFSVPIDKAEAMLTLFAKADRAAEKVAKDNLVLPKVPGIKATIEGSQIILSGWPGDKIAAMIRGIPTARWDSKRKAYVISARYSKAAVETLNEALLRMASTRAAIEAVDVAPLKIKFGFGDVQATVTYGTLLKDNCDAVNQVLGRIGKVEIMSVTFELAVADPSRIVSSLLDAAAILREGSAA